MKRYIASDFHNGNEVADYEKVMGFLDLVETDADEFLVLGDWEELLWSNMNIVTTVKPYSHVTEKIKTIAQKKPVRLCLGNHDWNLGLFASQIEPAKIVFPFAENGVYYTHGHEWDWLALITGTPFDPIYWAVMFPLLPMNFLMFLATRVWGDASTYSWGTAFIAERARAYAIESGCHTVVYAHTHYPADDLRGGIRVINSGDMLENYTYLVEDSGIIGLRTFV